MPLLPPPRTLRSKSQVIALWDVCRFVAVKEDTTHPPVSPAGPQEVKHPSAGALQ